eukprot:6519229-Prymnesium_polylepis.2
MSSGGATRRCSSSGSSSACASRSARRRTGVMERCAPRLASQAYGAPASEAWATRGRPVCCCGPCEGSRRCPVRVVHLMASPPRVQHFDLMIFAGYSLSLSVQLSPRGSWEAAAQKGVRSKKTDPLRRTGPGRVL